MKWLNTESMRIAIIIFQMEVGHCALNVIGHMLSCKDKAIPNGTRMFFLCILSVWCSEQGNGPRQNTDDVM